MKYYEFTPEYLPFVAVHEVGHVLCALELNMPIKSVALVHEDGTTGRVDISPPLENSKFTILEQIVFYIASDVAVNLYIAAKNLEHLDSKMIRHFQQVHAESDLKTIECLLDSTTRNPLNRIKIKSEARRKAKEILSGKWQELQEMVNELQERHQIIFQ